MLLSTQERFDMNNDKLFNGDIDLFDITDMQTIIGSNQSEYRPEDSCSDGILR